MRTKGRKNSEGFRRQLEEMRQNQELKKGAESSRKNKKNKGSSSKKRLDGVGVEVDL